MIDDTTAAPARSAGDKAATAPRDLTVSEPPRPHRTMVADAARSLDSGTIEASLSAIASASAGALEANGSAVGLANVAGDADIGTSMVGFVTAKGAGSVKQSYVQGLVAGDTVDLQQTVTAAVLARTITFERSGALVSMSGDTEVKGGVIGLLLSGRSSVSDDARVLLTGRALAVLALALFGGLGLVALAVMWGSQQVAAKVPRFEMPRFGNRGRGGRS